MPSAAAIIAHTAFWTLLACGWWLDELGIRATSLFLALWAGGLIARVFVPHGVALFPTYVAVLSIALVAVVFKGDVRLH